MEGGSLNRLSQLRALTASIEKGDAGALGAQRLLYVVDCLTRQQLLLEPVERDGDVGDAGGDAAALTAAHSAGGAALVAAVSSWVAAVQKLLNRSETQAAGAVLLGATCSSCGLGRLAASFNTWGLALLDILKKEQSGTLEGTEGRTRAEVQRACLSALAQLMTRLEEVMHVAGVRREGSPLASRAVATAIAMLTSSPKQQQQQQQQQQGGKGKGKAEAPRAPVPSDAAAAGVSVLLAAPALELIFACLSALPSSLRQQAALLEQTLGVLVAGRLRLAGPAAGARHLAARCLALVPRVQGSAEVWSVFARRALLSLADATDAVLMGLGDAGLATRAREHLSASELSSATSDALLGPLPSILSHGSEAGALKQLRPALDTLAGMLTVVEQLIVGPYPVPVPLPAPAILLALYRLVKMDEGAVLASGRVPPSTTMFAELSAALPAVRSAAWQLLTQLLASCRASLAPLHASLATLVHDSLRRFRARGPASLAAAGPAERRAMYAAAAAVARAGGAAAGRQLAAEALSAAMVELYGGSPEDPEPRPGPGARAQGGQRPVKRARQTQASGQAQGGVHGAAAAAAGGEPDGGSAEELLAAGSVLALLTSLVQVAGPLLLSHIRAKYDSLAAHMGTCTADILTAASRDPGCTALQVQALKALHLQSLELLQASLLAPCGHRPPYLGQALRLFKQGRSDGQPAIAAFCSSAILACEGLLHPRSLPVSSVQQYAGMQEVAALVKPRMWCVLDPDVRKPLAPVDPVKQPRLTAAAAAGAGGDATAQRPAVAAAAAPTTAAAQAPVRAEGQQQRPSRHAPAAAAAAPAGKAKTGPATRQHVVAGGPKVEPIVQASTAPAAAPAAVALAPAAAVASSVFTNEGDSSDSEGSLPEIDSGMEEDGAESD